MHTKRIFSSCTLGWTPTPPDPEVQVGRSGHEGLGYRQGQGRRETYPLGAATSGPVRPAGLCILAGLGDQGVLPVQVDRIQAAAVRREWAIQAAAVRREWAIQAAAAAQVLELYCYRPCKPGNHLRQ